MIRFQQLSRFYVLFLIIGYYYLSFFFYSNLQCLNLFVFLCAFLIIIEL